MRELIARLEAATGPDRELDAAIAVQVGINPDYQGDGRYGCPKFSASLDAALTLVPEGWEWSISGSGTAAICSCWNDDYAEVFPSTDRKQPRHTPMERWHPKTATPALALCIAALKAKKDSPNG